ncbi:MAG: hypothetical protein J6X33_02330 [Clostridiales bacterium]|nr:hypothetical protein [Clostridiales bacterium]
MTNKPVAVIDIGSITARIKIFDINAKGKPKLIEAVRKVTHIGSGSFISGRIETAQVDALCKCLNMFRDKCKEYKVSKVFCVATGAFRDAENSDVVVEKIRNRTGFRIDVLDNSMERYYQNIAVQALYPDFKKMTEDGTMILDLGAGSMQATVFDKSELVFSQNILLGAMRVSELLSDLENRTTHYKDVLEEFVTQDLNDYHAVEPKGIIYKTLIAFSGEMGYIKKLAGYDPLSNAVMSRDDFLKVYDYLLRARPTDLTLKDNVPSPIAPLLLPAALIVKNMLEYTGVENIHLPHVSLCDGIIWDYCYRHMKYKLAVKPDSYLVSMARNTAKRYRCDKKHIEFVETASLAIFDEMRKYSGLSERDRLLLQLAAIMHELGKFIAARDYSEASYDIIMRIKPIGLSPEELNMVALVVRLYSKVNLYNNYYYSLLTPSGKVTVSKLTAILRLADSLNASHKEKIKKMTVFMQGDDLHISCVSEADMSFEEWAFDHRCELFEEVMGIKPVLRVRREK